MNEETTFSIGQLIDFSKFEDFPQDIKELTKTEKREILMREIYDFYKAEYDKRRKENWKRYCMWCRGNRLSNTKENQTRFKRNKLYIKEISFESMKYLLKHIPLEDLSYFTSTGKEFYHTGRNFGAWLAKWYQRVIHSLYIVGILVCCYA